MSSPTAPARSDRFAVTAVLVIGMFAGGFMTGLSLINGVFRAIRPDWIPITLFGEIPISASGDVLAAHGDRLIVTAENLPLGALVLLVISDVLIALTIGAITVAVCHVIRRVLQGRSFQRDTRIAAIIVGAALALGSVLTQGAIGFAQMIAGDALSDDLGGASRAGFEFNAILPVVGLAILAVSYVFQAGERLQRDTEGLV